MKLRIIKLASLKYLVKASFIVLFIILLFSSFVVQAQTYRFSFIKTPLSSALAEIAQKTDIRISFDSGLMKQFNTTINIDESDISSVLSVLLKGTGFSYEYKYKTYLIIDNRLEKDKPAAEKILTGIVYDRETGERLPYATICDKEQNVFASTNVEGAFTIQLANKDYFDLQTRYLGYQKLDTVINRNAIEEPIRIGVAQKTQTIRTVNVPGSRLKMMDIANDAGHVTFNPSKIADLPNYGETDVFRALQLLPGISSFENSSKLNIRGSSSDQNMVLLDGFTLYNLDHFFGVFSAINPNVVKNVQVYRGGFDARYGERVSAVVDIVSKTGNQSKPKFSGEVNLISANLTAEIPVTEKFTIVAATRRAYSDFYSSWLMDELLNKKLSQSRTNPNVSVVSPKFYFYDYNLKTSYKISEKENVSFSLYGAKDNLESVENYSGNNDSNAKYNIDVTNKWGNYGVGATWNKQWSNRYFSTLQFGHSGYLNKKSNHTLFTSSSQTTSEVEETSQSNELTGYFLSFKNEIILNPLHKLEFGFSAKRNRYSFDNEKKKYQKNQELTAFLVENETVRTSQNSFIDSDTLKYIAVNKENSAFLYTSFFQDKIKLGNKLFVKPGIRINYYPKADKIYFAPRLSFSYKTEQGLLLKLATGRYYQYINKAGNEQDYDYNREFWVLSNGDENPVVSSNHFIAGMSFEKGKFYFDVEGYYKTLNGLQEYLSLNKLVNSSLFVLDYKSSYFAIGKGKAWGIDFLTKFEAKHFSSWLAYSLGQSTRRFDKINNGTDFPASFDQKHELKWTNIYSLGKWNFSSFLIYNTGKPYLTSSEVDKDFNVTRVYCRLSDYFRIDLSANYNFNIKKVNIKPGLSILNVLDTENYLDAYTRTFSGSRGKKPKTKITLVKAQSITFNFFVKFKF